MKIRSGFVSNSSSSSFVFVGFAATDILGKAIDPEEKVRASLSTRRIDDEAVKYYTDDKDYAEYRAGKSDPEFWKWVYQNRCSMDEYDAPKGLQCVTVEDEPWYGKRIASVEYGTIEIDLGVLSGITAELIRDYPGVTVKAFLSHSE